MVVDNDILMHHGIEGQKWGHKNGPPYPLDPAKDYSKAEKKAIKKAFRKGIRTIKKERKRYERVQKKLNKDAENKINEEEKKKKAINSGDISEIRKYKDSMSNEEIEEAINRIKIMQDLDKVLINDIKLSNERSKEELNKLINENSMRKEERTKKYGPGKGEATLEKIDRIANRIGNIGTSTNKVLAALNTKKLLEDKKYTLDKKKVDDKRKEREEKKNRLINRVINSGNENLINKHLNKMSNDQVEKALERITILNESGDFDAGMKFSTLNKKLDSLIDKYSFNSPSLWDQANYY